MATLNALGSLVSLSMLSASDVDFASFDAASLSTFSWVTTSASTIVATSFSADIAESGGVPIAGSVNALHAETGGNFAYDVIGMNGSLVAMTTAPNLETYWRAVLAGSTTIIPSQFFFNGAGDFLTVAGETVTGGNDVFAALVPTGNSFFSGDANSVVSGRLRGGDDVLFTRTIGVYAGDANSSAGTVIGGNDRITVHEIGGAGIGKVFAGDVVSVDAGALTGGNDTIIAETGVLDSVAGEASGVGAGVVRGGRDLIVFKGSATANAIAGDVDALTGGILLAGADTIIGGTQADVIYGDFRTQIGGVVKTDATHTGNDFVDGGAGNDGLHGQVGNDILRGGPDSDFLDGGGGVDTADYRDKALAVAVTLNGAGDAFVFVGGVNEDTIVNIERLFGGSAGDTFTGDGFANLLAGIGGADTLSGAGGKDVLIGGLGKDLLAGGLAADIFDFDAPGESKGANADTISDFHHGQHDRIDLRTIDAVPGGPNNAFLLAGTQSFAAFNATHDGGAVRAIAGVVLVDIGGNNTVDMIIKTPGATLVAADFLL